MTHDKEDFSATDIAEWLGTQPAPAPANAHDGFDHLAQRVRDAIHAMQLRHRLRREFERLDGGGELDRVLAEAQMSRGDIEPMLANYPESSHRLEQMAARLGLSEALRRDQTAARDLQHVCSLCAVQGQCHHWLKSGATEGFEAFCPNSETLRAMRRDARH